MTATYLSASTTEIGLARSRLGAAGHGTGHVIEDIQGAAKWPPADRGGNPYFVAEVLASGDMAGVPLTIAEAVRARLAKLDPVTVDIVERLAVVPSAVQRWLVEALVPDGLAALAPAEQRGLLAVSPSRVSFRHELARRAVVDSMPATRQVAANRLVLAALTE